MKIGKYITILVAISLFACQSHQTAQSSSDDFPDIFPDYKDVTIPSSISPLNFSVRNAKAIQVDMKESDGTVTSFYGKKHVEFPKSKWSDILKRNENQQIELTVSVWDEQHSAGVKYKSFPIYVSSDEIDPYIAYRLIEPGYESWNRIELCERELSSFAEHAFVSNQMAENACLNCHSFYNYSPDTYLFHVRGKNGGTVLYQNHASTKIDFTKLPLGKQGVYPMWHPSGRYIAFSSNATFQVFFHQGEQPIEVFDQSSDLILFNTENNQTSTVPQISQDSIFETFPAWSPDGKSLYFSAAHAGEVPDSVKNIHYGIMKVGFNQETGEFAEQLETICAATDSTSASWPRISPDGKYLLFTMAAYGTFPIWHKEADLQMIDLETGEKVDTDILNSSDTESYHSWSSNGKWVLFSSRRLDGRYTRLYIAHFDGNGHFGKPFLLPQKEPDYNTFRLWSYNVPEFVSGEIKTSYSTFGNVFKQMKK